MKDDLQKIGDDVVGLLKQIYDPEIPVNIYELGLIYDVSVKPANKMYDVKIIMTFTAPNCPVSESLPVEIQEKIESLDYVDVATIEITWDPKWTKEMMSEEAKLELGFL